MVYFYPQLQEYLSHENVNGTNKFYVKCHLEAQEKGVCIQATKLYSEVMSKYQHVYSVKSSPGSVSSNPGSSSPKGEGSS